MVIEEHGVSPSWETLIFNTWALKLLQKGRRKWRITHRKFSKARTRTGPFPLARIQSCGSNMIAGTGGWELCLTLCLGRKGKSWTLVRSGIISLFWFSDLPVYWSLRACWRELCCPVLFLHTYPNPSSCPFLFLSPHSHTISFLPTSCLLSYLTPWGREG